MSNLPSSAPAFSSPGAVGALRVVVAVALAAPAAGCGSSSSSDWVPDDIDTGATLDTVGAAGYARVCTAFSNFVHDQYRSSYLVQAVCTVHGIETTTDAVACADAIDACLSTLPPEVESQLDAILAQASCSTVAIDPEGCGSTVSNLTACLEDLGDGLDQLQLAATCAAAGQPVPDAWWQLVIPASCQALRSGCPAG